MNSTAYSFVQLSMSSILCKPDFSLLSENRSNDGFVALTEVHAMGSPEVISNKSMLFQKKNKNKTGPTGCKAA